MKNEAVREMRRFLVSLTGRLAIIYAAKAEKEIGMLFISILQKYFLSNAVKAAHFQSEASHLSSPNV